MVSDSTDNKPHARSQNSFLLPPPFAANRRAGKKSILTPRALLPSSSSSSSSLLASSSPTLPTPLSSLSRPIISKVTGRLPSTTHRTVGGRVSRSLRNARHSSPPSPTRAQILRRDFLADEIESVASWSSSPVHTKFGRQPDDRGILNHFANRKDGLGRTNPSPVPSSPASFVTAIEILPTPSPFPISASNTPTPSPSKRLIPSIEVPSPDGNSTTSHHAYQPQAPSEAEPYNEEHQTSFFQSHNSLSPETLNSASLDTSDEMPLSLIHPNIPYKRGGLSPLYNHHTRTQSTSAD